MEITSKTIDRLALTALFFATAVVWASKPFFRPEHMLFICLVQLAIYFFFLFIKRKIFDSPVIRPYAVKVKWFVHRHTDISKLISASCLINIACLLLGGVFLVIIEHLDSMDFKPHWEETIYVAGISYIVCLIITAIFNSLIYILDYWQYRRSKTLFILGCLAVSICPLIFLDIMSSGGWGFYIKGLQNVAEYAYIFLFCFTFLKFILQLKCTKRLINYILVDHKDVIQHFTNEVIDSIYD